MNGRTFNDLLTRAYQLYQAGEYAQAFDLLTRLAGQFPTEAHTLYFWRICLASRMDRTALALHLFEEALAAGHWFNVTLLREDTDLQPLQGLPQFEQLVEVSRERHAAVQAQAVPHLVTLKPETRSGTEPRSYPLLLALHGNNGTAESSVDFWRSVVGDGWLLALPQSSQVGGPDSYIWNDRDWAMREIQEHHAALCEQHTVDPERVIVAGFSMGGELAIWLAMSGAIEVRGFVAVGPGGPLMREPDGWIPLIEMSKARGLRGFIIVGERDTACYENSQALAARLQSRNIPCEMEAHPDLGHDFPPDFQPSLTRALAFVLESSLSCHSR